MGTALESCPTTLASLRQVIESVYDKLLDTFGLARERPHHLTGFRARLAAKVALHNFCRWLNHLFDRDPLGFAVCLIGNAVGNPTSNVEEISALI